MGRSSLAFLAAFSRLNSVRIVLYLPLAIRVEGYLVVLANLLGETSVSWFGSCKIWFFRKATLPSDVEQVLASSWRNVKLPPFVCESIGNIFITREILFDVTQL